MAEISFDLKGAFRAQWGFTPLEFDIKAAATAKQYADLGSPYYGVDVFGRSYYMPVKLGGIDLPHPFMAINGRKNIIESEVTERPGTDKQLINISDWNIVIRGFIIGKGKQFPEQTINELKELYLRAEALEIRSVMSDIFLVSPDTNGYDMAVIYDMAFPAAQGSDNVRAYEINLKSDHPFDLYID